MRTAVRSGERTERKQFLEPADDAISITEFLSVHPARSQLVLDTWLHHHQQCAFSPHLNGVFWRRC